MIDLKSQFNRWKLDAKHALIKKTHTPRMLFSIVTQGVPLFQGLSEMNKITKSLETFQNKIKEENTQAGLLFSYKMQQTPRPKIFGELAGWVDKTWVAALKDVQEHHADETTLKSAARITEMTGDLIRTLNSIDPRTLKSIDQLQPHRVDFECLMMCMAAQIGSFKIASPFDIRKLESK